MIITDGEYTVTLFWTGEVPKRGDYISAEGLEADETRRTIRGKVDKVMWNFLHPTSNPSITIYVTKE